jgi:hypothetical protein
MNTRHRLTPLVMLCTVADRVGCASADHRRPASSFKEQNLQRAEVPIATALPIHAVLEKSAFRTRDLNADGTVSLEEWEQFDKSASAKAAFTALDENRDGQINATEFLTQAPKHSERYHFRGDTDKTDDGFVANDGKAFEQPGWRLFSFHF